MKCRDCENLVWGYDEGERVWWCGKHGYCPDLDVERSCSDFSLKKPNIFTTLSTLQAENEKMRAELEQVTRDFDGICKYIDSEGFLRKQFCENGNSDLELCICPSLKEHPGYIDSDDCEGCDYFCNSWRGQKEG